MSILQLLFVIYRTNTKIRNSYFAYFDKFNEIFDSFTFYYALKY